jgi:hypothetical protein
VTTLRPLVLSLLVACAPLGEELDAIEEPAAEAPAAVALVPDAHAAAESAPEPAASCPVKPGKPPKPLAAPTPADSTAKCIAVPRKIAKKAKRELAKRWYVTDEGAKLEVGLTCDRLDPRIDDLIVELSSGHGHSLDLDRLRRRDDGDYDFVRLSYGGYGEPFDYGTEDEWKFAAGMGAKVQTAVLPGARVEAMLRQMRARLHLTGEEKLPPPPPGTLRGLGGTFSSRDFHVAYRMADAHGRGQQDFWVGYAGSSDQEKWLPLDLAASAYRELLWSEDIEALLTERDPTDEDRDFFAERFATARERNEEYGYWYLRERLLGIARTLGDARLMTALLALAAIEGKHSEARTQVAAVDVLVLLTGYDPRYDGKGTPRPGPDAAADMIARCGS